MPQIRVSGHEKFRQLTRQIAAAGNDKRRWRAELRNGVRRAVRPTVRELKRSAVATLPRQGGLGRWVATSGIRIEQKTTGRITDIGVRIKAGNARKGVRSINDGTVWHNTYGRGPYLRQSVTPGWFDKPLDGPTKQRLRKEVEKVVDDLLKRMMR